MPVYFSVERDGVTYDIDCSENAEISEHRLLQALDLALESGQDLTYVYVCQFMRTDQDSFDSYVVTMRVPEQLLLPF